MLIGGTGAYGKNLPAVSSRTARVVVTAVTVESVSEAVAALAKYGYDTEIVQIAAARSKMAGAKHLLEAMNPVTIITGEKI